VVAYVLRVLTVVGSAVPVPALIGSLGVPRQMPAMEQSFQLLSNLR